MIHKIPIPNRFLFNTSLECKYLAELEKSENLPDKFLIPDFLSLEGTDAGKRVQCWAAWCEKGLRFEFNIGGKLRSLWCNPNRPDESDRIEIWLDTRNVHNVHRASRYCHRFICLPQGDGENGELATIQPFPINRARQRPNDVPNDVLKIKSRVLRNNYWMSVFLPAQALTGFDPSEFHEIGFTWAVFDRDLGTLTLTAGAPFAYQEDPSLWSTLELIQENSK